MVRLASVCLLLLVAGTGLFARNSPLLFEPAEMVEMQQTIFSSGGTLELKDSYGDVRIVGWDQPQVEVTVTKSTQRRYAPEDMERVLGELDKILVTTGHLANNHIVIRTEFPARSEFGPRSRAKSQVNIQYVIRVPRQTRIVVRHEVGEVRVNDVTASMDVTAQAGAIQLDLPESEAYRIDAVARTGDVNSDWCDAGSRRSAFRPHRVTLRLGSGEIWIRKARSAMG